MDEIVRVVDALQLSAKHSVATPANWPHKYATDVPSIHSHAASELPALPRVYVPVA